MLTNQKVICDTNICYAFNQLGYDKFALYFNGCQLYMTSLTFYELLSSSLIKKNFKEFQNILSTLSKSHVHILAEDDILHILINLPVDVYSKEVQISKDVWQDFYKKIISAKSISHLPYHAKRMIYSRKLYATYYALCERICARIWAYRHVNYDHIRHVVIMRLKKEMEKYIKRHHIKVDNQSTMSELEHAFERITRLYVDCYSHFLYEVTKSYSSRNPIKIKSNDIIDFRNLLYCGGNDKYLTLERGGMSKKIGGMLHLYGANHEMSNINNIRQTATDLYASIKP